MTLIQEHGNPDWYSILLEVQNYAVSAVPSAATATSKSLAHFEQMKQTHSRMTHDNKWKLPSGVVVEDVMLKFAEKCDAEQ